jgi:L-iditol 2-dehydrogenase
MKACVLSGPGVLGVKEVKTPRPGPGELLLRVAAAGLCHSDIRVYRGEKAARPGVIPGHEVAGVVAEAGEGVGFRPGQRVALCPIVACGSCQFCRAGKRNRCVRRVTLGYDENGGLAEYLLAPEPIVRLGHVFPVPDGLTLANASLLEPAACVLNSLELLGVGAGTTMLLIGSGPMGLMHLVLARRLGASVIASEPEEGRRGWARRLGAFLAIDPASEDVVRAVKEATDGAGADVAVVSAGAASTVGTALAAVRRQGAVGLFAGFPPSTTVDLDPNLVHYSEVVLTGSQNATIDQYRRTLALLPTLPELRQVVTHTFSIDDAPKAYESRIEREGLKSEVVFPGVDGGA